MPPFDVIFTTVENYENMNIQYLSVSFWLFYPLSVVLLCWHYTATLLATAGMRPHHATTFLLLLATALTPPPRPPCSSRKLAKSCVTYMPSR